jgi:hypothetical protein
LIVHRAGAAVLLGLSLVAACAGARPKHAGIATPPPPAPHPPPKHARLHYELDGRMFPLPLVHGSVAGKPTWMIVDTGATTHAIAGSLARAAGLALGKFEGDVTDHGNKALVTYRVEHPQVAIDEWGAMKDAPMLVVEVPAPLEKLGIGAFVSPQRLAEADGLGGSGVSPDYDAVEMDLAAGTLRTAHFDDAARALQGVRLAPPVRACRDDATEIRALSFVVPGKISNNEALLLVDTGAQRTDLFGASAAARALAHESVPSKEPILAASGRVSARVVRAVRVNVGELAVTRDVDLVPGDSDPGCPRDGVVAMDVLRSCVLVLGADRFAASCAR